MPDSYIIMLCVVVAAQILIEMKYQKYWYVMPVLWFVFVLSSFLLGFFLQSHIGIGIGTYISLLLLFLGFSSPAFILFAIHFFLERRRKKKVPDTNSIV